MSFRPSPFLGQRINTAHPLAKGLVGCWVMNEKSGLVSYDLSGYLNKGTITGAAWVSQGLDFNGSSDYIRALNSDSLSISNQITIIQSLYPHSYPASGEYGEPLRKESSYHFSFRESVSALQVGIKDSTDGWEVNIPNADTPLNTWSDVAMTYDGADVKAYVNSKFIDNTAHIGDIDTGANNLFIGTYGTATPALDRWYDGLIKFTMIYNRALTPSEIKAHHVNPYAIFEDPYPIELFGYVAVGEESSVPMFFHHFQQAGAI